MNRAVFLDRDGTIIQERGYLERLEHLEIFPWTGDALRLLKRAGFATVVVTNQSMRPRAIADWFVTTTVANPARFSKRSASPVHGKMSRCSRRSR